MMRSTAPRSILPRYMYTAPAMMQTTPMAMLVTPIGITSKTHQVAAAKNRANAALPS